MPNLALRVNDYQRRNGLFATLLRTSHVQCALRVRLGALRLQLGALRLQPDLETLRVEFDVQREQIQQRLRR